MPFSLRFPFLLQSKRFSSPSKEDKGPTPRSPFGLSRGHPGDKKRVPERCIFLKDRIKKLLYVIGSPFGTAERCDL